MRRSFCRKSDFMQSCFAKIAEADVAGVRMKIDGWTAEMREIG
jgi:hypothetical protein